MLFPFVDSILERSDNRIVTLRRVRAEEDYLQDHFPSFPVLPGVLMVEAMVQAGRELVGERAKGRLVLGQVRGVKYGRFVKPGETMVVEVTLHKHLPETAGWEFKGEAGVRGVDGTLIEGATAVSGRFTLRPIAVP